MAIAFQSDSPQIRHFRSQIWNVFVFHKFLPIANLRTAFGNSFFRISVWKYPNKAFLGPNLNVFYFAQILYFEMFRGTDLKYYNTFFKFQFKNIQIRHYGPKSFCFFCFTRIYPVWQILGCWFEIWQKYLNNVFLVQHLQIFVFSSLF